MIHELETAKSAGDGAVPRPATNAGSHRERTATAGRWPAGPHAGGVRHGKQSPCRTGLPAPPACPHTISILPRMGTHGRSFGIRFLEWLTYQQRGGQFQELRGIVTHYPPLDAHVYRGYLPPVFDVPADPIVMVFVIEYLRVSPWPFKRYLESAVLLKSSFHGREGWFPVTMPVTTWIARQGGHHLGFPKFVTPSITLANDGDVIRGHATGIQGGVLEVDLRFTPDRPRAIAGGQPDDHQPLFSEPFHVLKPVGVGPRGFEVWFEHVRPACWRSWNGTVSLRGCVGGLVPSEDRTYPGSLHHFTGGMNLVSADVRPVSWSDSLR